MLYEFGVPVDILTLSLMLEQIYIAMRGGHKMSKNSLRAGIVCACGVAEAVSLKAIVRGAHGGSNPPHSVYPGSLFSGPFFIPSFTPFCMNSGMALFAQGKQIIFLMCPTLCQRLDVMHLLRLDEPAVPLALLTKRVCIHVPVTDAFPCSSVPALGCWVPAVLFVTLVLQLLMFLTEPAIRQLGTAGVGTRPLWFPWHRLTSSRHKESPTGFLP